MGPRSDRSTALRNQDLEGHRGARPKVCLRGGEHIGKFAEHITQLLNGRGGSSQGHESQTQSPAGGAAVGPRRARTKNAGPGSIVPVAPARVALRPRLPHRCQAYSLQLKPGSTQTGQGEVPQRGWRVTRHQKWSVGDPNEVALLEVCDAS